MIKPLAALFLLCVPALAKPVELVYRFDSDAPERYIMVQTMDQVQESPGMTVTMKTITTNHTRTELVEPKNDGTLIIQNTTDAIQFEMHGAGIELTYDSENPNDESKLKNPTIASLALLKGIGIQLHLDKSGTILDVPNLNQVKDSFLDMEDINLWMIVDSLTEKETIIAMNEANYKLLPSDPVEVGDSWNRSFTIPTGEFVITMTLSLTLDAITTNTDDQVAEISYTGIMTADYGEELNEFLKLENSVIAGDSTFNMDKGLFDSFNMLSIFDTVTNVTGGDEPDMVIKIEQSITNTRVQD